MLVTFFQLPVPVLMLLLGGITGVLTGWGTRQAMRDLALPPGRWPWAFGLAGIGVAATFVWCVLVLHSQETPEVRPPQFWFDARIPYHLSLIVLLLIVTATDLRSYYIVNWTCTAGIVIGLLGAIVSGQFQIAHVWVDWSEEIPQIQGPFIPAWLESHTHLHGLAWSAAGAICGASLTGLIRIIGSFILGMNALGSGDVWLMAMIGAYLGWQPVVVVTLIAPVLALGIGGVERVRGNRAALPYGPFLAVAALIVLFCWQWIWMAEFSLTRSTIASRASTFAVRRLFGDPLALLLIAGIALGGTVLLLGLLRVYKSLPTKRPRSL